MKDFDAIVETYEFVAYHFVNPARATMGLAIDGVMQDWPANLVEINEHAYFALLFFQFEDFIKDHFRALRLARLTRAKGPDRSAWEYIDAERVPFVTMIRMLLPERADLQRKVKQYYDFRNRIAHEAALSLTIVLEKAAADLKAIATCIASDAP